MPTYAAVSFGFSFQRLSQSRSTDNYIGMGTNPVHGAPHLTDWQSLIANNKVEVAPYGNGRQA